MNVKSGRPASSNEVEVLQAAVHEFFVQRAGVSRQRLRQMFRRGRISLLIGLCVLAASFGLAQLAAGWTPGDGLRSIVQESLLIGGWVAMWRPLEVFLYDWWPIRADTRLYDRLAAMPVTVRAGRE